MAETIQPDVAKQTEDSVLSRALCFKNVIFTLKRRGREKAVYGCGVWMHM